jgi:two-component system, OmpR family, response regulator RpaA
VIITDFRMPQGDGATVIECLKRNARTEAIPIIVLTARHEPGLSRQLKQIGAAACLLKPIRFDDLLHELKRYIEVRAKPDEEVQSGR